MVPVVYLKHDSMASIIPGYEYDIYISYRQEDNNHDGWVSEFIDHLKREIKFTFKEGISIYFDENPHDGLPEILNADKSPGSKLRSAVFIPVISHTYCDPESSAWQNEFVAFNKMASADEAGRDIKSPSGNVCSRIIPVKIHDLDYEYKELLEKELGCRLRSIDFVFSGAGISRPLKPDDNPDENHNKTFYRDQIRKVASQVVEIIYALHPDKNKKASSTYQTMPGYKHADSAPASIAEAFAPPKRFPGRQVGLAILLLLLILVLIFLVQKLV